MNTNPEGRLPSQVEFNCLSMTSSVQHVDQGAQALRLDIRESVLCVPAERMADFSILVVISYEPAQIPKSMVPPKRFYRTFWQSITRRILQRDFLSASSQFCD